MDTSRIQEILIIWGNSCTKGKRAVSLQGTTKTFRKDEDVSLDCSFCFINIIR